MVRQFRTKMKIIFVAHIIVYAVVIYQNGYAMANSSTASPDPCTTARQLSFLRQREVGYQLAQDELPICDQYFYNDWYEMFDFVTASTDEPCGTDFNWYRQGELPTANEQVQTVTYCLNIGNGQCGLTKSARVKKCSNTKYVFELFAVSGCSQAYCIERLNGTTDIDDVAPDISDVSPLVTTEIVRNNNASEIQFYCNFTVAPPKTTYFFIVEWGITTGHAITDILLETQPIQYGNDFNAFLKSTSLTELHLRENKFWRLGLNIACSTRAMTSPVGALSETRFSPSKFFGIEVLDKHIHLNSTGEGVVNLRLTAPFGCQTWETKGCSLGLTMFIPQNSENCRPSSLEQIDQVDRLDNRCGLRLLSTEIGKTKQIRVGSILGQNGEFRVWKYTLMFGTQSDYAAHPLFQNYIPDNIEVNVATDMTKIVGKWCYSQNDPHMKSFDGKTYENQDKGTFILYKNVAHNVQVQMKTTNCYPNNDLIWCNCGVAVNAGRDVFILDRCPDGNSNWNPIFRCKDRVLARRVKRDPSGTKFTVYLPTGTEVHITLSSTLIPTITIKASVADWENTEGLCGRFNGKDNDDVYKRPGSSAADSNLSWLVSSVEDLFSHKNDNNLIPWSPEVMQCHCPAKFEGNGEVNYLECHPDKAKKCVDPKHETAFKDRCVVVRRKRNAHGVFINRGLDLHFTTNVNFISHFSSNEQLTDKKRREIYDNESARAACLKILNTTSFQKCSEVPLMNIEQVVEECVLDAMATNSMEWTMAHLSALKDRCVYEVQVSQPLTAQDLAGTNSSTNSSSEESGTPIEVPSSPAFNPDFLEELEAVTCLNECSYNGRCDKGECICNAGFMGTDCSIDSSKPPVMEGIPDNGECDLQLRECEKTSVYGKNFVSTPNLSCNLVPFKVDPSLNILSEPQMYRKATLETFVEVSCPLKASSRRRSVNSGNIDYIAEGYRVSVSNDGSSFSEEDVIVIFDSECVNCSKIDGKVICVRKPGYCVKEGRCYKYGDEDGCYTCAGDTEKELSWISGSDCSIPIPSQTTASKLWIIPTVISPIVAVILLGLVICICKSKRSLKKSPCVMDSVIGSKPDMSSSKTTLH